MKRRNVILLLVAGLGLVSVWLADRPPFAHGKSAIDQPLVPGLETAVNDVTAFVVKQGDKTASLRREADGRWGVVEMNGYPAEKATIADLLVGVAKSDLVESKTSRKENYQVLGLDAAEGRRLTVYRGREIAADLWLGRLSGRERQTFVRYPDDPQVWLATGHLNPSAAPKDWLKQELADIDGSRVRSVVLHHAGSGDLTIARPARGAALVVSPMPRETDDTELYKKQITANQLAHLAIADVLPRAKSLGALEDTATFTTFDGLTIVFRYHHTADGDDWLEVDASASDEATDAARDEAGVIAERSRDWLYQFSPLVMRQLALTATGTD